MAHAVLALDGPLRMWASIFMKILKSSKICTKGNSRMLNPNLKTVFHENISLNRFEGGHAESAIIHSGLQNTQQAGGKLPFTADPIQSIGCITIP